MIKIKIAEKEFELKFTIESWKKLKSEKGITPQNFQDKVQEDIAESLSALIFYGLSIEDREKTSVDEIDRNLDFTSLDTVSKAIVEGLPEASKKTFNDGGADSEKK